MALLSTVQLKQMSGNGPAEDALTLSSAQKRLWFLAQMEGIREAHHISLSLHIYGELDFRVLKRALDRIVERHLVLRASFECVEGQPLQRVAAPDSGFELQEHDLSGGGEAEIELERIRRHEAGRCFDLEHGPLIRGRLFRLAAQEHVLLISMHNLVSDAWSIGILTSELSALYQAYSAGDDDPLPQLTMQYADYARWQQQQLNGAGMRRAGEYWRRALEGAPALLELPTDRPRQAEQASACDVVELRLNATLTRELKALSQRHAMTVDMLILAAWSVVLSRLSGQKELVLGVAFSNRTRLETQKMIGPFANKLALRIETSGTMAELLEKVKTRMLEAREHQELPFEQVVEIVKPPRSIARAPIFQAMLVWQEQQKQIPNPSGPRLMPEQTHYGASEFDLELALGESGDRIVGGLRYAAALFDRGTIEWHAGYLRQALAAIVADESQETDHIPLLSDVERVFLLELGNGAFGVKSTTTPEGVCLYGLVATQAERSPLATAVIEPGGEITYRQLVQRANGLGRQLRDLGVGPETRVAILVDRSAESLIGVLGILAAGGAYVPMDPSFPEERIAFILEDASVRVLLTPAALAERARTAVRRAGIAARILVIADAPLAEFPPDPKVTPESAAYVIYTSGSTGTPKGVVVEHHGAVNLVRGFAARHDFAGHRLLMIPPLVFDASVGDVFPALAAGGTLVLHPAPAELGWLELEQFCREFRITAIDAPAALWRRWTDGFVSYQGSDALLPDLTLMMIGGENVPLEQVRLFAELTENRVLLANHYGPTEASVCATMLITHDGSGLDGQDCPIGKPLPGVRVYVLDEHLQLAPRGVVGELCIGGAGVAREYLNRAELTASAFIDDPFFPDHQARMYRTGDLVRWNADGTLQFIRRRDHQVKIRGLRVELGEIEACLAEHPSVREAVVLAREDHPGNKLLVAYVTAMAAGNGSYGAEIDVETLRLHLSLQLPAHMVPAAYVLLKEFPLNANGKLDRKKLPAPDTDAYLTREYEAPVGEIESTASSIWADVLKLERVGRNDNFFELGGHSLLAITVIERMREAGFTVDVRDLFASPTLKGLAEAAGKESREIAVPPNLIPADCTRITPAMLPLIGLGQSDIEKIADSVPGGAANVQDIYPLAPLQEGILFHHLLETEGDVYLTTRLLAVGSRQHLDCYLAALQAVINRHDILRTAIVWKGLPEPVQVVWRHAPLSVEEVSLDPAEGDIAEQLRARFNSRHYRLDVRRAPLFHLVIAEDPANHQWLILELMHHLIGDQMTSLVMQQEIQAIVQGEAKLPAPRPFRDFVVQARQSVSREEHEAFFTRMLKDVDEPTAPFGLTDVQGDGSRIVEMRREIDSGLSQRLHAEARRLGVTLASICHVAWALVLACVSGRNDVVFGTVMFGRMQSSEGSDRGLGLFINTLPLRIQVGDEGVATSVRKTHELLTQLLRHEHASLGLAQRCSSVRPPVPLFTSLLNYRHVGDADAVTVRDAVELPSEDNNSGIGLGVKLLGEWERTNFPFGLYLNDMGQNLSMDVQVDSSIHPQQVSALMQTALEVLGEALQNAPERALATLSVLSEEERQQVLYGWNATQAEYPQEKCLHELFEEQVAKTPDNTALVFEKESLSYAELNWRANCLAHCLREMGVKADERVGICAERGIEMVVALFAVLKAGGAYVPLDPDYPEERLQYMLKNSRPVVVLSQGHLLERMKATSAASGQEQPVIDLTVPTLLWQEQAAANLECTQIGLTPDHLAYVIYTSGSTGAPKGAGIEHKSIVNRLIWMQSAYELKAEDAVLQKTPFSFDVSVWEFFWPLLTGARLVMARPEGHKDPTYLCETIAKNRITTLHFVPSMLHAFLEYGDAESCSSIRNIICSGEALSPAVAWRCRELLPNAELHNLYGPTEAAVDVTAWTYPAQAAPETTIPIGRPIANTQMYILDSKMEPVPRGVVGELYIGGVQVGRGYLNRDELTAERFVKDPFAKKAGARMYRTGDLGRWLEDGNIEYLGRNDFQVKVRGFRIELGEIESRLLEHDGVREAVVVAREDRPGEQRLVAYYVGRDQVKPDVEQLRRHLAARLPEYMVPAAYVSLEELPLTSNGKLDRKALPSADSSAYVTRGYEPPVDEAENTVASIWADVLKLERVGRNDNFFELGGHSLLAVTVIERMREAGLTVDVRALFASPTLKGLAEATGRESQAIAVPPNLIPARCTEITPAMLPLINLSQSGIEKIVASVPGGAANIQDIYPLAPLQEGILFHHRLTREGDVYLTGTLLAIESREDLERHLKAVQTVIDRHDILRTAIVWEGLPEPVQVVWRQAQIKVEEATFDPGAGDIAQQLLARFSPRHYRLDVRQAPLWRLFIAEDVPNRRWVILDLMHHMVVDHVTLEILQQEIQAIAQGKAAHLPPPLPFRNFVAQARLGISHEEHETFFTRMLGDVDEPTAPFGLTNVQGDGSGTKEGHRTVDSELFPRLRTQARATGVSVASMCHLAWALVLARTSGRDDVVFGTVMFGRMQGGEGSDRALGIFINTLPLRIQLGDENVQASVRHTHALLTQLLRHEHASLGLAQRCSLLRPPAPLFTSILNYRHTLVEGRNSETGIKAAETWAGWKVLGVEDRNNYPFALSINDFDEGLSFDVKVDGSIDPQQVCDLMHTALESLTDALESNPSAQVRSVEVLPSAVREQLVHGWNVTETEYPENTCIHLLFEKQVERTPELGAVASQGESLSYRELNRRASQLGHYLRNLGVGPDIRVGICMKRGVEMIVGLLGIMKAGGAYVPLDPAYPEERLRYMMEDAGILIVVTQKEVEAGLRSSGIWLVCVDEKEEMARIAQESQQNPEAITAVENLAYVIYTSGSTGKSKGVGIEHRQLANYVNGILRDLKGSGLKEGAKYATVSTLSADLGNTVIYPSLVSGGELHVIDEAHVMDGQLLGEYFEREQIDCLKIVPSHLQGLRGARGGEKVVPRKMLVVGGEASTWEWVKEWTTASECAVMNHYGPTETTVGVLRYPIKDEPEQSGETVPIGQPLGNVQAYVVNRDMEPVPIGVAGELYIGGAGVGRGYVNRAELTAERFVPDPFSGFGQRLYKTGDLVRRNKDGNIEFLGRADHQVKIRGFRIELGEIEAALRQQPGIEHAVVVVAESANDSKRLVAYVTSNGPGQDSAGAGAIDIEALRTQLGLLLPDYMVPAAYVVLDKLPLTANGKLDRKALPSPDSGAYVTREYEAPVGEVETILARIWAEVLKLDRVGRNDNFFELGGHSLLAITVIERMREAGLILEVGALFDFPILKGLAETVGGEDRTVQAPPNLIPAGCIAITPAMLPLVSMSQREVDKIVASVPGGAANVQDIYPLAPLQEGILFHHLLTSEGDIYLNQTVLGGSRERLDRYIKALQVVIDRHDILRTAVAWEGLPEPVQVVWRHAPLSVEEISLDPTAGSIVEQLRARFNPQHYRLDVRQAPLWRLIIAQDVPNNRWVMLELAHHLVADNTSIRFLLREIEMILQGQAELLPAPLPFRNFVAQARLGVSRQEHETFFTRMLGDVDEPTAPFGLMNVQGDVSRILEGHRTVDVEVCRRLRLQARSLGVSAASLCHLAWALVLARTSGRDDVVFGTVMFGRMQGGEGSDRVMGIFINTLPLRIKVGDDDVRTSVRKTQELQTQLLRHEHASLALVQRCSSVAAPAPLFTSILNYRHLREEAISAEKGAEAMVDLKYLGGQERNNYPFALAINDLGEAMTLDVKVDDSIDPQQVCAWMHTALESLVEALESAPDMAVRRLEVLPAAEREQLVYSWNQAEAEYAPAKSIHGLFEEQAERTPELRAVVSQGKALSYLELNQRANQLAHYLRKQGVRPDDRVGIFMKRDVEMVVGLLGILKAGAAYVGLDITYPEERLRYMIEDADARIVLTQQKLPERLRGSQAQLVCLDEHEEMAGIAKESRQNPGAVAALENLVYVIYTSGSTGKPKGVGIEHRQLVNYVRGISSDLEKLGVGVGAKYATVSTLSADLGNTAIYPSLLSGGELHVIDEDHVMDGQRLGEYFEREKIDCLKIVPSHLEGLRGTRGGEKVMPRKVLVSGGEALPWKWARDWQMPNECTVINHYGPTETTVGAVRFRVPPGETEEGIVPIGQPLGNVQLYVMDQHMELVPSGGLGELYIGGAGVGRGYVNRAELTAERFVPDPFFGSGQRLYKTGDLVRRNKDGNIEFLGRVDQQVKIRGFRIELGEIEAALRQQPGIEQAAMVATEGENGSKRLVAYLIPSSSPENGAASVEIDVESLRVRLSSLLPEYMVPAAYVLLKEFPLNANGKLDRKKLPAPDTDAYLTREYEAPVGEIESTASSIWADVLKLERVGRNDNFFELGGHSLLAITVIERMREAGFTVDVRDLFASPTLKGLAEAAGKESREIAVPPNLIPADCTRITPAMLPLIGLGQSDIEKIADSVPGGAANVQDIYPLAPLQEGILFHHLLETEGDVYLSATLLGAANRERLDRYTAALQTVVDRHDILRTAIVWEGLPEPVQVVWRRAPLIVEEVNLDPAKGDIAAQLRERFDPRHNRLDIRQAPMWRLYIARDVPNQRWVILELKHHLTGDNTTARFLLNEVRTILQGQAKSLPEPLPFRNFVAQARLGVSGEEHEVFFTRMLKDVDEPTVPFGLTNVQGDGSRIVEAFRNVDARLSVKLRALARALGVTVASMCHLAWAMVLARTSGRDDVVFGTVLFGRMQAGEGADRGLGIFINTLPVRIHIGDEGVATSVRKTHQLLTELFRHEHASLALVQRCSSVQAPAPLFTSLLNYRHVRGEASSSETAQTMANLEFIEGHGRTNYPFGLYINDLGQDLSIEAQVEGSIAPQRICALMHTALESLVRALENAPESPVATLSVLPDEERRRVLYIWNATETGYPKDKFLHELFEEQVERTPHATAVVLENQSLTYNQLNQHANRLAHYLRSLGVKPDARVGICVERGIDTIVALLAVLKAEGAYVPLDPGYPVERLRFMLKDSAPMALLTHFHLRELFVDIANDIPVVDLNGNGEEWSDQPATNPKRSDEGLRVENLAYVIYTSGSTGVPKGVALEHRNAVNYVCWARENLAASTLEQTLFSTSLNFDLAVFECFAPLTTGGTIRIVANVLELENHSLDVTLIATVPSAMRALVESSHVPSTVRAVVLGGELLKKSLVEKIFATTQVENVCNIYGPTETTTNSTWMETKRGEPYGQHIGRPVANTQVYILDPRMEPVPVGVVGEIYIAGAGVTRGYLNRPQLTAERFLKDPFAGKPEARMYRTGDLGRWLEDGNIEYRGRNDFQVKVRGVRIELGEIEARLLEHTGVREAIVMAREDKHGEQHLVAYYTPSPEATPEAEELRKHLAEKLTEHMVPRLYVSLDRLPLTASGKLDRKALPAPDAEAYEILEYEPPQGETEAALATIWAEILKLERVGRNDNFFDAGGHSLLAIQLGNRIRATLGVALELRDIFAANTLKDMATVLNALIGVQDLLPDSSQVGLARSSEGRYL